MPKCCATWRGARPCAHSARNMDGQSVSPLAQFHVISVDRIGGELRVLYGTTIRWLNSMEMRMREILLVLLDMFALRPTSPGVRRKKCVQPLR